MKRISYWACVSYLAVASVAVLAHDEGGISAADAAKAVKLLDEGKLTLARAIEVAEKETGGRAFSVMCEMEGEKLEIDVNCVVGDKIKEVDLDGAGKVTEVSEETPSAEAAAKHGHDHMADARAALPALDAAKMTLAGAIEKAEAHSKGRAVAVLAGVENKEPVVYVACLTGDKLTYCTVAKDGKVTAKPADEKNAGKDSAGQDHGAKKP